MIEVLREILACSEELNASGVAIMGEFNADPSKKFYEELYQFCITNNFNILDTLISPADFFTYISAAHDTA